MNRKKILNLSPKNVNALISRLRRDKVEYRISLESDDETSNTTQSDCVYVNRRVYPRYCQDEKLMRVLLDELRQEWRERGEEKIYWNIISVEDAWGIEIPNGWGVQIIQERDNDSQNPRFITVACGTMSEGVARVWLLWRARE